MVSRSLTVLLGVSAVGLTSYVLYWFLKPRKDDIDDDDSDPYIKPTADYNMIELQIPKEYVRSLIGRNGNNIKHIQAEAKVRINFSNREGIEDKICIIKGATNNCQIAQSLIISHIQQEEVKCSEDVWVPSNCIKKIIGRGGEMINEIRNSSGASSIVINEEKGLTTRIIIKGRLYQVLKAKSLIEDIVDQHERSLKAIEESLSKRLPRLPPRCEEFTMSRSGKTSPVSIEQENIQFEVYVSAMESPSKFWLQIVGPKAVSLDLLIEEMTMYYESLERSNCNKKVGDIVAAIYPHDSKWYRAEVLEVIDKDNTRDYTLYYLDYGDLATVDGSQLEDLRTDFLTLHFQAIECFLARVEPVDDKWSEEAINYFEELTQVAQWKKFSAKINGYIQRERTRATRESGPVPGVDLFNAEGIDIAEELVNAGYAVFKKGSDLRSNSRNSSMSNVSVVSGT